MLSVLFLLSILISKSIDYSSLSVANGKILEANYLEDDIEIELDDGHIYTITSVYLDEFDWNEFLRISKIGDTITFRYENISILEKREVHYVEVNEVVLLSEAEALKAQEDNLNFSILLFTIFSSIALLTTAQFLFYKHIIYKQNLRKEVYDLSLTKEEINFLYDFENNKNSIHNVYIKTTYPKKVIIHNIIIGAVALALSIISFRLEIRFLKYLSIYYIIFCIIKIFDVTRNHGILNKDTLIVKRFFKIKKFSIVNIQRIEIKCFGTYFIGRNGKTLCRIASATTGFFDIIDILGKNGFLISFKPKKLKKTL
ncbi:MAG: hypothetical protein PHX62_01530 [Bacilli bacterium]|nr:hypothetical protein [Bacilli bacterium]